MTAVDSAMLAALDGDLFSHQQTPLQRLPLPGAQVDFLHTLPLPQPDVVILRELISTTPWLARDVVMWGKPVPQPRLVAWYGDAGTHYAYSSLAMTINPWTPLLLSLKAAVEAAVHERFNSVLLNYYRDQHDSVAMHSDNEKELGPRPPIASLSLGQQRNFVMKHRHDPGLKTVRIALPSGCLLLMRGDTQRNWKHGIEKENRPLGPRVNLTFRRICG